jgi:hypothetical protein
MPAMRHEFRSWLRIIAFGVGVLAVVIAALALSAPTADLLALRPGPEALATLFGAPLQVDRVRLKPLSVAKQPSFILGGGEGGREPPCSSGEVASSGCLLG